MLEGISDIIITSDTSSLHCGGLLEIVLSIKNFTLIISGPIRILFLSLQGGATSARQPRGRRELPRRAQQLLPGRHQVPRRVLPPQEAHHLRTDLVNPSLNPVFIKLIIL